MPAFGEMVSQLFEGFSNTEVAEFESLLGRMRENLRTEPQGTR